MLVPFRNQGVKVRAAKTNGLDRSGRMPKRLTGGPPAQESSVLGETSGDGNMVRSAPEVDVGMRGHDPIRGA